MLILYKSELGWGWEETFHTRLSNPLWWVVFEKAHHSKILYRHTNGAGLKAWQRGDGGECLKIAHGTELELDCGIVECLLVLAPDKTTLNQALEQSLQDFEVTEWLCPSEFGNCEVLTTGAPPRLELVSLKKPWPVYSEWPMWNQWNAENPMTTHIPDSTVFAQSSETCGASSSTYTSRRDFENFVPIPTSASLHTKTSTLVPSNQNHPQTMSKRYLV